jgi:hypothetical protein
MLTLLHEEDRSFPTLSTRFVGYRGYGGLCHMQRMEYHEGETMMGLEVRLSIFMQRD